ncbi:CTP-dependent riboflavin kinase [Candidatus Bathyarchaeota archaeon]|nr:CTP-dependent riboflavin kinase [Candidatus Bathyarchaeota archaeon]
MKAILWFTLLRLAEEESRDGTIRTSTPELASKIKSSQQTASRHLRELEKTGLIERTITSKGETVRITERGREQLQGTYFRLKSVLEEERTRTLTLDGEVVSGVGEGAYYMSLDGYRKQFKTRLGFEPFPGTLNLKLSESSFHQRKRLDTADSVTVKGFENEMRTYGDVECFTVLIQGKAKGAIVIIDRTHYTPSILELVSPVNLREELGLKDGDTVKVEVPVGREKTSTEASSSHKTDVKNEKNLR